jgi:hypothetical protein
MTTRSIPVPAFPRRLPGRAADGRRWELLTARQSVTAVTAAGTVAEAHVSERADVVVLEFWTDTTGLPAELPAQLVDATFTLPAVRPHRPVVVCVPQRDGNLLAQARRRVADARTRSAGVTCLIEGRVGESPENSPPD